MGSGLKTPVRESDNGHPISGPCQVRIRMDKASSELSFDQGSLGVLFGLHPHAFFCVRIPPLNLLQVGQSSSQAVKVHG